MGNVRNRRRQFARPTDRMIDDVGGVPQGRGLEALEGRVLFATFTWDGADNNDPNWQTAVNWAGDVAPPADGTADLVFPGGATQKFTVNDFPGGTPFRSISFAGGYSAQGAAVDLGLGGVTATSGFNQLDLNLTLIASAPLAATGTGTLRVNGTVGLGANALTVDAAASTSVVELWGEVSGAGAVTKDGGGVARFVAASTYSGGTTLSGGTTYAVNATGSAFGTGGVTNTAGALRGDGGFAGALANNAGLLPGSSVGAIGRIATGGLTFGAAGDLGININGAAPGTGHDVIDVTGAVNLDSGHALNTSGSYAATGGERLFVIVNDGSDPVVGAFAGLENPNTDTVEINGVDYRISYTGDSGTNAVTGGNDVVLYVEGANAAPVNTVPGTQTTNEDTAKVFSTGNGNAISIADADAGSANVRVELSANNDATINIPAPGSLISAGANNSSGVTLTGSQTAINAALNGMGVTPAAHSTATVTLMVDTSDLGNTGGGGAKTDGDTVTINVTPVNDAPFNTLPAPQGTAQNTPLVFSSGNGNLIAVADPDAATLTVTLTATSGTIALGGTGGITVHSGDPAGDAAVSFSGSPSDVNAALVNATFTPAGNFSGAAGLQVSTTDGTLTDTDALTINVASAGALAFAGATEAVAEDDGAGFKTITVSRTGGTAGQVTVAYATSNGTAAAGGDYTTTSGTLTFANGETSKTFNVPITDDALDEDDETVNLTLSSPGGGATLGAQLTAVLAIADNDASPTLSIGDASVAEGNAGTHAASFTVTLSAASGRAVTVDYAAADGTATAADNDYSPASGTLTFAPGETTKAVMVNAIGDATVEANETFTVTLSTPANATIAGGTATGSILDDDTPGPQISFAQDVTVAEGDSGTTNATFTINLSVAGAGDVVVSYATQAGTAAAGDDFTPTTGTLTFAAGQTSKTVNVPVVGDVLDEDNETFGLVLSGAAGGQIADAEAVATIQDDDAAPTISVADAGSFESPADGQTTAVQIPVTVTLSAASGKAVTVAYATADGTAVAGQDYVATSGVLTFAPGETTKTIVLTTVPDAVNEDAETLTVTLSGVTNAVVDDGQATVTILDDGDAPPSVSVNDVTAGEPAAGTATDAVFTVSLSGPSGKAVTVDYATAVGTAGPADFQGVTGTLTFAPGETGKTVSVAILADDAGTEPDEAFTLVLSNPSNATIAGGTGTATILGNANPVAADDVVTLAAGQVSADVDVLANDTDADGDPLTAAVASNPANGSAVANSNGTIRYTPNVGFSGADSFTYAVSDGRGGTATGTVNLTVTGNGTAVNPTDPKKTDLFVAATGGSDQIQITKVKKQLRVVINGEEQGTFTANGNVVISGGDGDDNLILGKVKQPVLFNGGAGNDTLGGGGKGDILVGGPGDDTLTGGAGRDLIIGGAGTDTINGGSGADVLISGTTAYDADTLANRQALNDLLTELAAGRRYSDKLARLQAGVGGSNARLFISTPDTTGGADTIFDDAAIDNLNGAGDADFFVAQTTGSFADVIIKKARNEGIIEL